LKGVSFILVLLLAVFGCQSIAGIKDRHYDDGASTLDDAGAPLATSPQCKEYCEVVMDTCQDPMQVYPTEQVCQNVCTLLPAGQASDTAGNSVACRNRIAIAANSAKEGLEESCPAAGPGGGDVCGSDCESYCYLYAKACPKDALDDCEQKCKGLPTKSTFDAITADHDGDSLQCRLVHVSNAVGDPTTHCKHARIVHPENYCSDEPESDLSCKNYCRLINVACDGDEQVYQSNEQCQAVCEALGPGKVGDQSVDPKTDSMSCRLWHAYTAVLEPSSHCAHAGPGGDGHCGDGSETPNCPPYCKLLKKGCAADFEQAFDGETDKCESACADLDGAAPSSGYSVKSAPNRPSSLQCRMLYTTRAVAGDEAACADALGDGEHCHD
jgi:hypothetical protein